MKFEANIKPSKCEIIKMHSSTDINIMNTEIKIPRKAMLANAFQRDMWLNNLLYKSKGRQFLFLRGEKNFFFLFLNQPTSICHTFEWELKKKEKKKKKSTGIGSYHTYTHSLLLYNEEWFKNTVPTSMDINREWEKAGHFVLKTEINNKRGHPTSQISTGCHCVEILRYPSYSFIPYNTFPAR